MTGSSIIPERQFSFSPALAATIGLEEAILLQLLGELLSHHPTRHRDGHNWLTVDRQWLLDNLPFWSAADLHRITRSLEDKGVVMLDSPPLQESHELVVTLDTGTSPVAAKRETVRSPTTPGRAGLLPPGWTPTGDLLQLLDLNHAIPRQFALDQLEDFVFYWRERGEVSHAWENKFRQHVLSRWRRQQQQQAEQENREADTVVDNSWYPHADALEILERMGVNRAFIDDAVPEFVLYWRERDAPAKELNSRFVAHIRRQWARYTSALSHDTEPRRITPDWQPAPDVFDILQLSHIDEAFARSLLPEFVLYWRDSNQLHSSWNTKFLQHVKYKWANRHQFSHTAGGEDGQNRQAGSQGSTRARSLTDDLTDRSWAS